MAAVVRGAESCWFGWGRRLQVWVGQKAEVVGGLEGCRCGWGRIAAVFGKYARRRMTLRQQ